MGDPENRQGANGDGHRADEGEEGAIPFYPLHMMKEIMVTLGILAALFALATFLPAHLKAPADSFNTPPHIKPEWYFLAAYQALKYFPSGELFSGLSFVSIGVLLINFAYIFLFILPFVDRYKGKAARKRPLFLLAGVVAVVMIIALTYLGHFSGRVDPIFHRQFK